MYGVSVCKVIIPGNIDSNKFSYIDLFHKKMELKESP